MSPNNMSGSGRTTTTATTTSPARVRRGRSADRSEDRSLRRLSSACRPSCFSPRHGRSSALPRAHDGSRRGGVSGGGGGDSGHERSRTNRQDARSSGRERGGGIGGGDVGRVGGSRDARSSSYGAAKRGRSEDRRDAGSVRDRRPRSREDVRSSGRGTRTKRGRSEDRGDAGTARERRPRSREGARWSSRDRNIGGRCRDRADGRSSAGGGLERRRTSAVAGSRGGDGDDNRRERPSSRGAGDASFAGRRRTDGGEGEGKRSGALGGDSKRHRSGSRDNGRRTAAIRSPSSRDDDGRERNTAFSCRRDDDDDDDVRVNRRYPRDGAAASRNPRPRDQAAASSPPPLRISTTGQPSRGNGNGDRTPMTPTEKWKAPLSSSPRERRAAHTPSHRSSLSTRRDGRSTRPPSSSTSSPLVGQEAGGGTGKEKAEEAEVDGMELPRHLLGQKPDFEAEGGGRGEELKFADNIEVDPHRLATRQKQIDFGMNTLGYETYLEKVPRNKRRKTDPATPDKTQKMSKRRWAGKIRSWRRQLHQYDASTTNTSASGDGTPPTRTARDATEAADEEGDFKESGEIGLWSSCSSSDDDSGANGGNGNNNGSPTFDLDAAAAAEASWSPTAATMAAAAATPALVVNVGEGGEDPRYAGAAEPGSKDSHPSTRGTSLTSGESAFSLTAGHPHATHQQPQQQQQQHINAGIYADDDDGFGESRSGGGGGVSDDLTASSPFEGGEDGVGGARKRRRGDRASSSTAGTAAPSPWGNSVEYWSGESGDEDEDEDEDEDDGEGTGRRRRKRRRRWGGNRTSKLGGGEQLRPGELLADEEEELEGKRLNEVDGNGVAAEVEVKGDGEEGSFGAGVKEELAERGVDGVHVDGGAGGARFVREESRQMVVEGAGLQDQVKAEMEATGVGVKQELELDEDAFSDDELL